jgi:hypothetical protein
VQFSRDAKVRLFRAVNAESTSEVQFNMTEGRIQAKGIRDHKERFAIRNEVRNEERRLRKVKGMWLQS